MGPLCAVLVCAVLAAIAPLVSPMPSGSPSGSCASGVPGGGRASHGSQGSGNGGFGLSIAGLSGTTYTPGVQYTVTLSGSGVFDGFLITLDSSAMGSLAVTGADVKAGPCGASRPSVTHTASNDKSSVSFLWTTPASGQVAFRATVLTSYGGSWFLFSSPTYSAAAFGTDCSKVPTACASLNRASCALGTTANTCGSCLPGSFDSASLGPSNDNTCEPCDEACSTCSDGSTTCPTCAAGYEHTVANPSVCTAAAAKTFTGSASYPSGCSPTSCLIEVQWGPSVAQGTVNFYLRAKSSEWVALGFGSSRSMAGLDVYSLHVDQSGVVSVFNRYASAWSTPEQTSMPLFQVQGGRTGSYIEASFSRSLLVSPTYTHATNFSEGSPKLYIAVAHGNGFFDKHSDTPLFSTSTVDVYAQGSVALTEASSVLAFRVVHGILMMIAFILCMPIGTFLAHFSRIADWSPWFQIHRAVQVVGTLFAIISLIYITTKTSFKSSSHQIVGIICLVCVFVQVLLGVFRNVISSHDPANPKFLGDHGSRRWLFNALHRVFGFGTHVLSFVAIWLGLVLVGASMTTKSVYGGWLIVIVVIFLIIEPVRWADINKPPKRRPRLAAMNPILLLVWVIACVAGCFVVGYTLGSSCVDC